MSLSPACYYFSSLHRFYFVGPMETTQKHTSSLAWSVLGISVALTALASLVVAAWAGLGRLGAVGNAPSAGLHGPIMVFGFLGTVITVERAVGLRRRWGWWVPVFSALGGLSLLVGLLDVGAVLLALAGVGLTLMYVVSGNLTGFEPHTVIMGLGAASWVIAAIGLVAHTPIPLVVPALTAFLVLTISGERVELSRLGPRSGGRWTMWLLIGAVALFISSALAIAIPEAASAIAGGAMMILAVSGWYGDIARRTIKMSGLPRFMAAALLAGYFWLFIGGITRAAFGSGLGSAAYDIALHTVFVGFVLSMVFAHAAVIVPAVTGIDLPYRSIWWVPLVVLHVSLLARVVGRLTGTVLYTWGGVGHVVAIATFVAMGVGSALVARAGEERVSL